MSTSDDPNRNTKLEILTEAWQLAKAKIAENDPTQEREERAYWAGYANAMHAAMLFVKDGRDPREDTRED